MNEVVKCILFSIGISLIFTLVSQFLRVFLKHELNEEQRGFLSSIIGFVSTLFAFVLGFLIVNLWTTYNGAESIVQKEVNSLRGIYRLVSELPDSEKVVQSIHSYLESLSHDEWPAMQQGHFSPKTDAFKDQLWHACIQKTLLPSSSPIISGKILDSLMEFNNARRERIALLESELHPLLVTALMITGGLTWIGFVILGSGRRRFLFFTDFVFSACIAINIYLLLALDKPFSGKGFTISDSEFVELAERVKAP
ncbi:MAG: hypothetical protein V4507_04905 [Verrucomicrobiota bacterium]